MLQTTFDYLDKNRWDEFVMQQKTGHVLQTWEYGEVRKAMGTRVYRVAVCEGDEIKAAMQVSLHPIPHVPYVIGYVPRGPVCDFATEDVLGILFKSLKQFAEEHTVAFIKIEPNVNNIDPLASVWVELLQKHGKRSANPRFMNATSLIDLTKSEEDLLAQCRKNTRYAIRKSQKEGVVFFEDTSENGLNTFYALLQETAKRQHFQLASRPKKYFELLSQQFAEDLHLYFAYINGEPVATVLNLYNHATAYYPYGASSVKAHGTTITEGLLWHSILKAKDSGCTAYDLWGVLPREDKNHPYWGYTFFKNGFGGALVEYIGSYDIPFTKLYYPLQLAEKIRRMVLRR